MKNTEIHKQAYLGSEWLRCLVGQMPLVPYVGVFGSSTMETGDPKIEPWILPMVDIFVANGFGVVNGGYGGTMKAVAEAMVTRGGITVGLICEKVQDIYKPQSFTTILSLETPFQRLEALVSIPKLLIFFSGGVGTLVEYSTAMWSMDRGWIEPKRMILLGDHWRRTTEQICNSPFGLRHNSERPLQILEIDKPATLSAELTPILHEIASND